MLDAGDKTTAVDALVNISKTTKNKRANENDDSDAINKKSKVCKTIKFTCNYLISCITISFLTIIFHYFSTQIRNLKKLFDTSCQKIICFQVSINWELFDI